MRKTSILTYVPGAAMKRPNLSLALLALLGSGIFSVLLSPDLVKPLKVNYLVADGYAPIAHHIFAGKRFEMGGQSRFDRGAFSGSRCTHGF